MERIRDQAPQAIAAAEVSRGEPLAKTLLALNNAHAQELSWLEPERLEHMVGQAFLARRIGNLDAYLLAFDQDADYDSPNFLWFRTRYPRFVYVDRIVVVASARGRGCARRLYRDLFEHAERTAMSAWSVRSASARRTRHRTLSMPRWDLPRSAAPACMRAARRCGICCAR
jgi:predicted GNAT superfamily acetyltransferase